MYNNNTKVRAGVSGMSLYVPPLRVPLQAWCEWTGASWSKLGAVVGRSFRMAPSDEDVYTMAASAVLRLLSDYAVDPESVGYLALGTESSRDNSAGAVIVRGMVDQALKAMGQPGLRRSVEVPEYKHACLGGVYALKGALRFVSCEGRGCKAIVVASDIAEYARGSSGEPTQGAGAVAMLVDEQARLFRVDLSAGGAASAYRGPDFRKPLDRHFIDHYSTSARRYHDFPVFSGKYSTYAYLDQILHAVRDYWRNNAVRDPVADLANTRALFFHRPYQNMPVQGLSLIYLAALAATPRRLAAVAEPLGFDADAIYRELKQSPDLFRNIHEFGADHSPYPLTDALARAVRKTTGFKQLAAEKMTLGAEIAMELGNLYTAALPAWLAAGFEEALGQEQDLSGARLMAVGYGSGDAAEVLAITVSEEWREAAARLHISQALQLSLDLDCPAYQELHDERSSPPGYRHNGGFYIDRIGETDSPDFQDVGVPYYGFSTGATSQGNTD